MNSVMTGNQILKSIEETRLRRREMPSMDELDLRVAVAHNIRRKRRMLLAIQQLDDHRRRNGALPEVLPSVAFDPCEGGDRTNIYYVFKALKRGMPWEINRELLVEPTALTFDVLDLADELFPSPVVTRARLVLKEFVKLWALPKERPGLCEREKAAKRRQYMRRLDEYEGKMTDVYLSLSVHFRSIEEPQKDPLTKKIDETNRRTKGIAGKVGVGDPKPSAVTQERAVEIWNRYRLDSCVVEKGRKTTYAMVYDYCRRQLNDMGIRSAAVFRKVIRAYRQRNCRAAEED